MTSACRDGCPAAHRLAPDTTSDGIDVTDASVRLLSAAPGRNDTQPPLGGALLPLNRTQADPPPHSPTPLPFPPRKRALPERAESETRSSVAPSCPRLPAPPSPCRLSDCRRSGVSLQPEAKPRSLGLADERTRWAARRDRAARLVSASPSSAAVEKPGRRPAVCAQPPAGLRPGLPLFPRNMDGFTGSLGESLQSLAPRRSPAHRCGRRRDGGRRTRL